jgi:hypothetical protein
MKKKHKQIALLGSFMAFMTIGILMIPEKAFAQDIPDYNKWGVDIGLSSYMGKKSDVWSPFTGQLDVPSGYATPGFQANVRYYLSPAFSLQGGVEYFRLTDDGESARTFSNDLVNVTARANVYLGRLFELGGQTWSPNFHFGFGRAYGSLSDVPGQQDMDTDTGNYYFGYGVRRQISNLVDIYGEYSYHIFTRSNIDGLEFDSDRLGRFTVGVSFKLGSKSRPHAEWYPTNTQLYATNERLERTNSMILEYERRLNEQENLINELKSDVEQVNNTNCCGQVESLQRQVQVLSAEVDSLKNTVVSRTQPSTRSGYFMQTVPSGYYVQVFADYTLDRAQYALELTKAHFEKNNKGNQNYVITKTPSGTWHIVLIGPYTGYSLTTDILNTAKTLFDDSYVEDFK